MLLCGQGRLFPPAHPECRECPLAGAACAAVGGRKMLVAPGSPSMVHSVQVPHALHFQTFPLLEQNNKRPALVFLLTSRSLFPSLSKKRRESFLETSSNGKQCSGAELVLLFVFSFFRRANRITQQRVAAASCSRIMDYFTREKNRRSNYIGNAP